MDLHTNHKPVSHLKPQLIVLRYCLPSFPLPPFTEESRELKCAVLAPHLPLSSLCTDPAEMEVLGPLTAIGQGFSFLHKNRFQGGTAAKNVVVL